MFTMKNSHNDRFPNHNLAEIAMKSGFRFRDIENHKLDWKSIGCVDVNKVIESQDYDFLQKLIPKIIEAPMQSILNSSILDPAVASLFRLAQLSLQYLSFCQQFMDFALFDLRTAYGHLQKKNVTLRQNYKRMEEEHYKAQEKINQLIGGSKTDAIDSIAKEYQEQQTRLQIELKSLKEKMNVTEREIVQINNGNNNDETTIENCLTCAKRIKPMMKTVGVQYDEKESVSDEEATIEKTIDLPVETEETETQQSESTVDEVTIKANDQFIDQLKAEIEDLRNSMSKKAENASENIEVAKNEPKNNATSQQIVEIKQKFSEFEAMYARSQTQFIESFQSLDERQKVYMDKIQDSIKEIVEKSLVRYGSTMHLNEEPQKPTEIQDKVKIEEPERRTPIVADVKVLNSAQACDEESTESLSEEETEEDEDDDDVETKQNGVKPDVIKEKIDGILQRKLPDKSPRRPSKVDAIKEFEDRLQQFGIDSNTTGISTPRRHKVSIELAEEREEIKRAHKTFVSTRNKLKSDIEKIARSRLNSASSLSSLQSIDSDAAAATTNKRQRPKSANVLKRRDKNILKKFVGQDDIDEENLLDKMKMAQKAIDAHRECIQELLQTTTHSPKSIESTAITKRRISTAPTTTKTQDHDDNGTDNESNRYNKMPNVTTRRVVFVNLDEDS